MTRKFALVLLSRLLLAISLAGAAQAVGAEPREKIAQSTPAPVPVPPSSPLSRSSIVPPSATSPEEPATIDFAARLDAAKQSLDQIDALLAGEALTDADLVREAAAIDPVSKQIQTVTADVTPRLAALKTRLDQLGPGPDPKADPPAPPEDPAVAQDRADQMKLYSASDDLLKRANLLQVRADQLAAQITERRRTLFANAVFQRGSSILDPGLWMNLARDAPHGLSAARSALVDFSARVSSVLAGKSGLNFLALLGLILVVVAVALYLALRLLPRAESSRAPSALQKAAAALWTAVAVAAIPIAGVNAIYMLIDWFGLNDGQMAPLTNALFRGVIRCALVAGLGIGVLAPGRALWRPLDLSDRIASRLFRLAMTIAVLVTLGKAVEAFNQVIGASFQATVAARGVFALLVGVILARGLFGVVAVAEAEQGKDGRAAALDDEAPWWPPIRFAAWAATFVILAADFFGYVALAAFIVDQLVWTAVVASLLFLLLKFSGEGIDKAFRPGSRLNRGVTASLGLRGERLQQIGVLLGGAVFVALCAMAALLVLTPWGVASQDLLGTLQSAFFGVKIGDVTLSLSSLFLALLFFALGYALTHAAQNWLENRYLPLTGLDIGLRASIRTSVGYIGILLSILFASAYLGINTEKLALVAGALSVGIGLGLQSVVNNFVSGLILLWERLIRVGDWVVIGDEQGYVRRINVRSTEIETFDRATMIVPNGNMVTGIVKNFVRGDRVSRIKIPVQAIWGSDPEKVREVLLEAARSHEEVQGIPAPAVLFSGFGATSLNFELVCFVEDVERASRVKSDLHYAIFKLFREAGLRMDPPQQTALTLDLAQLESLSKLYPRGPDDIKT
ncbi:DUF3772 domain-containing protein [uncultured Rhodoblastus sp.]|uniref:DUF3772 domain-containing protein n=1 Tax=uncultured Rhodoblastus sp. TaxID=543037 RepID=UPI0025FE7212|nr:DUF3772 domain-containing protein [uncultured Rhodoblastus sp.]